MHQYWLKGHKDREARIKRVKGYRPALEDLKEILEQNFKKKEADRDYGEGWELRQIATNEYNAALADLMKLLDIKE